MFNVGDRVRYHGRYRKTHPEFIGHEFNLTNLCGYSGSKADNVCYIKGPSYPHDVAVWVGDIELAAPAEPEEYESWFV